MPEAGSEIPQEPNSCKHRVWPATESLRNHGVLALLKPWPVSLDCATHLGSGMRLAGLQWVPVTQPGCAVMQHRQPKCECIASNTTCQFCSALGRPRTLSTARAGKILPVTLYAFKAPSWWKLANLKEMPLLKRSAQLWIPWLITVVLNKISFFIIKIN